MKCPGQDTRYWSADAITEHPCPHCSKPIEFYKDDTNRKCDSCGKRVVNPSLDFGCASYCQFAEQCLGTLPEDFKGIGDDLLKDRIAVEVKRYLHTDFKTIQQTITRARFAESIAKEQGDNPAVVLCAAYLQNLPPQVRREILARVNTPQGLEKAIIGVLEDSGTTDAISPQILSDATILAELQIMLKSEPEDVEGVVQLRGALKTESAKTLASQF